VHSLEEAGSEMENSSFLIGLVRSGAEDKNPQLPTAALLLKAMRRSIGTELLSIKWIDEHTPTEMSLAFGLSDAARGASGFRVRNIHCVDATLVEINLVQATTKAKNK